jgi:hypothetical protein
MVIFCFDFLLYFNRHGSFLFYSFICPSFIRYLDIYPFRHRIQIPDKDFVCCNCSTVMFIFSLVYFISFHILIIYLKENLKVVFNCLIVIHSPIVSILEKFNFYIAFLTLSNLIQRNRLLLH